VKGKRAKQKSVTYSLTVAAINEGTAADTHLEVTFSESARFYKISKNANPAYIRLLKESRKNNTPVMVKRANEDSDVILSVKKVP
jgi:hypothetical protein